MVEETIIFLKFARLIKIHECLVKYNIVQTKCPANVWSNVTLSGQSVQALSKKLA